MGADLNLGGGGEEDGIAMKGGRLKGKWGANGVNWWAMSTRRPIVTPLY